MIHTIISKLLIDNSQKFRAYEVKLIQIGMLTFIILLLQVSAEHTWAGLEAARQQGLIEGRKYKERHPGSDQYKKYNCLILIDNPSAHDLFPALEKAFCYEKRHCKECDLS